MNIIQAIFVDESPTARKLISNEMYNCGIQATCFTSSTSVLEYLHGVGGADAIILDWAFQPGLGLDLLILLQEQGIRIPVVFFTNWADVRAEYAALEQGAADFVDRARGVPILALRLNHILRFDRIPTKEMDDCPKSIEVGRLKLFPDTYRTCWDGEDVDLTITEFKIVGLLVAHLGEYVTYRAVYDRIRYFGFAAGSGENGYRTNVRAAIKRIRSKFTVLDAGFAEIENFSGFGYRWSAMQSHQQSICPETMASSNGHRLS